MFISCTGSIDNRHGAKHLPRAYHLHHGRGRDRHTFKMPWVVLPRTRHPKLRELFLIESVAGIGRVRLFRVGRHCTSPDIVEHKSDNVVPVRASTVTSLRPASRTDPTGTRRRQQRPSKHPRGIIFVMKWILLHNYELRGDQIFSRSKQIIGSSALFLSPPSNRRARPTSGRQAARRGSYEKGQGQIPHPTPCQARGSCRVSLPSPSLYLWQWNASTWMNIHCVSPSCGSASSD